jgi:hypothetical protein
VGTRGGHTGRYLGWREFLSRDLYCDGKFRNSAPLGLLNLCISLLKVFFKIKNALAVRTLCGRNIGTLINTTLLGTNGAPGISPNSILAQDMAARRLDEMSQFLSFFSLEGTVRDTTTFINLTQLSPDCRRPRRPEPW